MREELFGPLHAKPDELESRTLPSALAQPISPRSSTGWARIDEEVAELRRHFHMAGTPQDYRNIGNDCVTITEMLSRQVYDPEIHLRDGEQGPPVDKTKIRIERYIEDALLGPANANPRKLVKTASESNAAPPQCAGAQGSPLTL